MGTAATAVIGIDVSKAALDACLLAPGRAAREKALPNAPAGFAALLVWADAHAPGAAHFGMEATGGYEDAVASFLHAAGRVVSVVNPTRVKYAGAMRGRRNKTDKADARPVAAYTRDEAPAARHPPSPEVRELQALVRRRDDLRSLAAHEKGRLDAPLPTPTAGRPVARVIKLLAEEADAMPGAADALIAAPALKADRDLLASIPGVGTQTASTVLAELPITRTRMPIGAFPDAAERHRSPVPAGFEAGVGCSALRFPKVRGHEDGRPVRGRRALAGTVGGGQRGRRPHPPGPGCRTGRLAGRGRRPGRAVPVGRRPTSWRTRTAVAATPTSTA